MHQEMERPKQASAHLPLIGSAASAPVRGPVHWKTKKNWALEVYLIGALITSEEMAHFNVAFLGW